MFNFKFPSNLDLPDAGDAVTSVAKDAVYITVGSGVIAFQRAQVARRDLQERLPKFALPGVAFSSVELPNVDVSAAVSAGRSQVTTLRARVGHLGELPAVHAIDEQVQVIEDRVDVALDAVESKLPTPAQFALNTVREATKDSTAYARGLIGLSA